MFTRRALIAATAVTLGAVGVALAATDDTDTASAQLATAASAQLEQRPTTTSARKAVSYGEELPANWAVVGVAPGDVLEVRQAPGTSAAIVATLAADLEGIESTGRTAVVDGTTWREIQVPGATTGWAAAVHLDIM